jgi:hypothetical protein
MGLLVGLFMDDQLREDGLRAALRREGFDKLADSLQFVNGIVIFPVALSNDDRIRITGIVAGFLRPIK